MTAKVSELARKKRVDGGTDLISAEALKESGLDQRIQYGDWDAPSRLDGEGASVEGRCKTIVHAELAGDLSSKAVAVGLVLGLMAAGLTPLLGRSRVRLVGTAARCTSTEEWRRHPNPQM